MTIPEICYKHKINKFSFNINNNKIKINQYQDFDKRCFGLGIFDQQKEYQRRNQKIASIKSVKCPVKSQWEKSQSRKIKIQN